MGAASCRGTGGGMKQGAGREKWAESDIDGQSIGRDKRGGIRKL